MADDNFQQRQTLETSRAVHIAALTFVMLLPTVATLLYFVVLETPKPQWLPSSRCIRCRSTDVIVGTAAASTRSPGQDAA